LNHCIASHRRGNLIQIFDVVDRILRQQKEAREEARAAAESKVKDNQNNIHPLHPLGAGIKQFPDPDSHSIPPQHEPSQTTDHLGKVPTALGPGSKGSAAPPPQVPSPSQPPQTTSHLSKILTALKPGSKGSAAPPPQFPSPSLKSSESFVEHKPRTPPISAISSSTRSPSSNSVVTPLSHICAFMI